LDDLSVILLVQLDPETGKGPFFETMNYEYPKNKEKPDF
jgi:hypothetical protein